MAEPKRYDVVVVGGGPAGVSCALECHDVQLDVLLLEARRRLGGQLAEAPNSIKNLAAGRFSSGEELRCALEDSAALLGSRCRLECELERVDLAGRVLEAGERIAFRTLLIATGRRRRQLALAREGDFGGDVSYQMESRRSQFAGRPVAVVGGGDSAALDALELARAGSMVRLIARSRSLSARADILRELAAEPNVEILCGWQVESLAGSERLESITVVEGESGRRVLEVGGLVVKLGYAPNSELFRGQVEQDPEGAVVVGPDLATSRPGVFAAGDVVSGAHLRVATAMGQGVLAGRSLLTYLGGS